MRAPLAAVAEQLGRPPYFPLDSHWTSEGALEMVRQVAERLEAGVTEDWDVVERDKRTANADLPPLIGQDGINEATTYRLATDGENYRTNRPLSDLRKPVRRVSTPRDGMVRRPTLLLGDSFSLPVSAYLPTAFTDTTQVYYSTIDPDPGLVARTMADNEVVILEMVERNIARGDLRLLDRPFLDLVRQEMQNRPIR
jgi:alginate O-acetyltransferase complex protein AlgJ